MNAQSILDEALQLVQFVSRGGEPAWWWRSKDFTETQRRLIEGALPGAFWKMCAEQAQQEICVLRTYSQGEWAAKRNAKIWKALTGKEKT